MTDQVRTVSDVERRARLGVRHALAAPAPDVVAATRAVVCLHATEPTSMHLSAWARSGAGTEAVEAALRTERTLVKQLAMRRTVFALPLDLLPAVRGSAAARVAGQQRALLARSVAAAGLAPDGGRWVDAVCAQVLERLHEAPATTARLRGELPVLAERLPRPESPAAPPAPVASRVLTVLAASGQVVRGDNDGGWTTSRPVWTPVERWLPHAAVAPLPEAAGYAELVRRWLRAYGPGSEDDLVWWSGATRSAVRRALADVGAVPVLLEDATAAWLHPDDVDEVAPPEPWAALLPALDPTTMGWRGRGFHLATGVAAHVYDRAGNGLPTAWWDGRVVGTWGQRTDGSVAVVPAVDLPPPALDALDQRARDLTRRLDGHLVRTGFQRPDDHGTRGGPTRPDARVDRPGPPRT